MLRQKRQNRNSPFQHRVFEQTQQWDVYLTALLCSFIYITKGCFWQKVSVSSIHYSFKGLDNSVW